MGRAAGTWIDRQPDWLFFLTLVLTCLATWTVLQVIWTVTFGGDFFQGFGAGLFLALALPGALLYRRRSRRRSRL